MKSLKKLVSFLIRFVRSKFTTKPPGGSQERVMRVFPNHMSINEDINAFGVDGKDNLLKAVVTLPVAEGRYICGTYQPGQAAYFEMNTILIPEGASTGTWEFVIDYAPIHGGTPRNPEGAFQCVSGPITVCSAPITWVITDIDGGLYDWQQLRVNADALKPLAHESVQLTVMLPDNEGNDCRVHSLYLEIPVITQVSVNDGALGNPRVLETTDIAKRTLDITLRREQRGQRGISGSPFTSTAPPEEPLPGA